MNNKRESSFLDYSNNSKLQVLDNNSIDLRCDDTKQLYKGLEQISPMKSFLNNQSPQLLSKPSTNRDYLVKKVMFSQNQYSQQNQSQVNSTRTALNNEKTQEQLKKKYTFMQILVITLYVQQFIKKVKNNFQGKYALRSLNQIQLNAINDISHTNQETILDLKNRMKRKKSKEGSLGQKENKKSSFLRLYDKIPVIQPNQSLKILFDCQQSYWILFRMFFTTIKLFFFITDIRASVDIIKDDTLYIINASFWIDMILNLFTGYYDNGIIVMDKKLIALKYLKGNLKADLLAQMPLIAALMGDKNSDKTFLIVSYIFEFLIFFKIYSLTTTFNRLERVVTEHEVAAILWPLVRLFVNVLILSHIVGTSFYGIAIFQKEMWQENRTWLDIMEIQDEGWFLPYLYCLYWAFCTMVSNSMYTPKTKTEILYSLIMILVMTGIFGYLINTVGMIMSELEKKTKNYKLERQRTNRFMQQHNIPEKLKERVSLYLDHLHEQEKEQNREEEQKVLERLSEQLRLEILQNINEKNIKKFIPIQNNFSQQSLNSCLLIIQEQIFSQGDTILDQQVKETIINESNDSQAQELAIYVIQKGEVQICKQLQGSKGGQTIINLLKPGQSFGDFQFFTGQKYNFTAKAGQACSILKITRNQFLQILDKHTDDMQKYCMIKDQLIQYNTSIFNQLKCEYCQESGHFSNFCSKSHLQINIQQLIYDYNHYNMQLGRSEYDRIDVRSHHALIEIEDVQYGHEEFIELQEQIIDDYWKLINEGDIQNRRNSQQQNFQQEQRNSIDNNNIPLSQLRRQSKKQSKQQQFFTNNLNTVQTQNYYHNQDLNKIEEEDDYENENYDQVLSPTSNNLEQNKNSNHNYQQDYNNNIRESGNSLYQSSNLKRSRVNTIQRRYPQSSKDFNNNSNENNYFSDSYNNLSQKNINISHQNIQKQSQNLNTSSLEKSTDGFTQQIVYGPLVDAVINKKRKSIYDYINEKQQLEQQQENNYSNNVQARKKVNSVQVQNLNNYRRRSQHLNIYEQDSVKKRGSFTINNKSGFSQQQINLSKKIEQSKRMSTSIQSDQKQFQQKQFQKQNSKITNFQVNKNKTIDYINESSSPVKGNTNQRLVLQEIIAENFISMEDFDRLKEWNVYWTTHNFSQIRKQPNIEKYFKKQVVNDLMKMQTMDDAQKLFFLERQKKKGTENQKKNSQMEEIKSQRRKTKRLKSRKIPKNVQLILSQIFFKQKSKMEDSLQQTSNVKQEIEQIKELEEGNLKESLSVSHDIDKNTYNIKELQKSETINSIKQTQ